MATLHYARAGSGKLQILLIPGWASTMRLYIHLVEEFAQEATFWMVDLPGHGQTPSLDPVATIPDYVDCVEAFCDEHALQPDVIIAHSMGGLITLQLAHRRPDLMQRMVLICPVVTGKFGAWSMGSTLTRTPLGKLVLRNSRLFWELLQRPFIQSMMPDAIPPNRWVFDRVMDDFQETDWATGINLILSMSEQTTEPYLASIQHPTLLMVGTNDLTVPPSEGRFAAEQMPNAQLALFTQSRHLPFEEEPQKAWDTLRGFLVTGVM